MTKHMLSSVQVTSLVFSLLTLAPPSAGADDKKRKSVYVDPKKITDSGTRYSDTDLRILTGKMIESMITSVIEAPGGTPGEKPIISMGRLQNRSTQNIDVNLILETIEVGILKSKAALFVNRTEAFRQNVADEDALMQTMGDTGGPARQLMTYRFLLDGAITEIPSNDGKTRYYKLALTLTDIRSSVKVWAEEQEIKKQR